VMASSKDTPCFLRLATALAGSNSKLGTGPVYGLRQEWGCDLEYVARGSGVVRAEGRVVETHP
jgi:hypothetical protein